MAYEIYLERVGDFISLSEWKAAVEQTPNVRLASGDCTIINPKTNEAISIPNNGGDVEVCFSNESKWIRVFSWYDGVISFNGLPDFENPNDILRQVASTLADTLNARIVGDDGEFYN